MLATERIEKISLLLIAIDAQVLALNVEKVLDVLFELFDEEIINSINLADKFLNPLVHQVNRILLNHALLVGIRSAIYLVLDRSETNLRLRINIVINSQFFERGRLGSRLKDQLDSVVIRL